MYGIHTHDATLPFHVCIFFEATIIALRGTKFDIFLKNK